MQGDGFLFVVAVVMTTIFAMGFGYQHGKTVGSLEVLASRGCMTDFECEVLVEGD